MIKINTADCHTFTLKDCYVVPSELEKLRAENERLRDLVQCLLDNDPNADAADGVTVLDVWRGWLDPTVNS